MQMVYKIVVFILIADLLSGCLQNSELNKMSNKEIEKYFGKHKIKLKYLVEICEKNPAIKRVEKDESLFYEENISVNNKKIVKKAENLIKQLKIDNMQCSRSHMILDNELLDISFWLYSAGLGVSGEGQLIRYRTKKFRNRLAKKEKVTIPWETVYPLPEEGWSIINTK